jgi:hypothetical protein
MKLMTEDYAARTMEGGCCFGNVRTNKYMKLSGICLVESIKILLMLSTHYFKAKDWFIETRDEGYFATLRLRRVLLFEDGLRGISSY